MVEEPDAAGNGRWRRCLFCGVIYDRGGFLGRLERAIRDRYRLPPSPWTTAERATDTD